MKKYIILLVIVVAASVIMFPSANQFLFPKNNTASDGPVSPKIISVSPSAAAPGSVVHVAGVGFVSGGRLDDSLDVGILTSTGKYTSVANLWQGIATDDSDITFTLPTSTPSGNYVMELSVHVDQGCTPDSSGESCNIIIGGTSLSNQIDFSVVR